ncbi:hypothetical protein MKX08_010298 [Trichoderma sp. CBMAI-0020]|nr:hypothetical protein MKX08_010298 [Trichoderma sp. CBMAI-0020]
MGKFLATYLPSDDLLGANLEEQMSCTIIGNGALSCHGCDPFTFALLEEERRAKEYDENSPLYAPRGRRALVAYPAVTK